MIDPALTRPPGPADPNRCEQNANAKPAEHRTAWVHIARLARACLDLAQRRDVGHVGQEDLAVLRDQADGLAARFPGQVNVGALRTWPTSGMLRIIGSDLADAVRRADQPNPASVADLLAAAVQVTARCFGYVDRPAAGGQCHRHEMPPAD